MANAQLTKERALITGASAGIGLELAREFARNGHPLILAARSEAKLNEFATELTEKHKVDALVIPADLSDPNGAAVLFSATRERGLDVDIL